MIFINHIKSAKAAKDYYSQHIAPGDYYSKDAAELKGIWHGTAAQKLGLAGEVNKSDVFALCDNRNPETGKQLTPRTRDDRRVLTDVTFDAPKAVSLAYELGGDEQILDAFRESVRETMAEIEISVQTRVRKKGSDENRTTGNMVWSENIHRTTRPVDGMPDPQLHCHATIFNATWDDTENRWKAIQLGDIVRDKGYYQAAFHARLANKLKGLGYGIEKDRNSFTLAGISRDLVEDFSRRSAIINEEANRRGVTDAKAKGNLGRKTREKKAERPLSISELREEWKSRVSQEGLITLQTARDGQAKGDDAITPEQAKEYALEHSFQNASTVSEKRLKAEALIYAVGSVRPEDVADISQHPEVIAETRAGQLMTTTKTVLRDEVAMLQFAKDGQRKQQPFMAASDIDRESLSGLSEQQRNAVLNVVMSRDTVTGIVGKAGTGKTHTLQTLSALIGEPQVLAPSASAVDGLKKDGFANAMTVARFLLDKKAQEAARRKPIMPDEAGLISAGDMRKLFDIAKTNGNRVILSGDYTQHASVEAGDAFRLLEKEAGIKLARLTEVRRQREPGYRKAVEAISEGTGKSAQKGFDALDRMGNVIEASGEERHKLLVDDYLAAQSEGASALIIAPTHSEGEKLTQELRTALKERGAVGVKEKMFVARRSTGWTDAQKGDIRNYEAGMVVEFNQNVEGGFRRGDVAVVVERGERGAEKDTVAQKTAPWRTTRPPARARRVEILRPDGTYAFLPEQTERFDVYRTGEISIARGDRIRITKNGESKLDGQAKGTRLNNGDLFTVEGFTKDGDIRLDKGKYLPKDWGHMSLGYVDTSYSSQGKTVDRVFIAAGNESLPATNQQQWYVSASRGRDVAKLYVDSKEDVRDAFARTGQRLSAVELTHTKLKDSWRARFHKSLERNRVAKFLKERVRAAAESWNQGQRRRASHG